jgi:phosphohistidine phosphatase SixA
MRYCHHSALAKPHAGLMKLGQNRLMISRRIALIALLLIAPYAAAARAQTPEDAAWAALKKPGTMVLFRHALAPGGGDPPGFKVGDCSTQRNLSDEGQSQAKRMGQTLRARGVQVQAVWHSQWCRTKDTAALAFPDLREPAMKAEPAFNSFFSDRSTAPAQTAAAKKLLLNWRAQDKGVLVVVTHQVNITQLTEIFPQSGEGIVLERSGKQLKVIGRILP